MNIAVAVVGYGRAGKTSSAGWMSAYTPLRYVYSTSQFAKKTIELPGSFEDRAKNRTAWANAIYEYNLQDGGIKMYKDMLPTHDIFDGLRRVAELRALAEYLNTQGVLLVTIWIHRPGIPADPGGHDVGPDDCMFTLNNNGDLHDLYRKLQILCGGMTLLK